jgi:hypothetical protein
VNGIRSALRPTNPAGSRLIIRAKNTFGRISNGPTQLFRWVFSYAVIRTAYFVSDLERGLEPGSRVTDASNLHSEKQYSQIISIDEGM